MTTARFSMPDLAGMLPRRVDQAVALMPPRIGEAFRAAWESACAEWADQLDDERQPISCAIVDERQPIGCALIREPSGYVHPIPVYAVSTADHVWTPDPDSPVGECLHCVRPYDQHEPLGGTQ